MSAIPSYGQHYKGFFVLRTMNCHSSSRRAEQMPSTRLGRYAPFGLHLAKLN